MESDELEIVAEDIEHLGSRWVGSISKIDVRHGGALLRRLLIEGGLGKAWRAVGFSKEPNIIAMNLDLLVANIEDERLVLAEITRTPTLKYPKTHSVQFRTTPGTS